MTSALSDVQRQLAALLRRRKRLDTDPEIVELAARYVRGSERLSPAQQLEVYREQFWLRHTSCLLEDFPGLSGILGQRSWERLIEGYLETCPPTHYSLRDLGARLPEYVETQTWLDAHALCCDMARLEWAYIEAFDAADGGRLEPAALMSIEAHAWATARLSFAPALRLLRVDYPVPELRLRLKQADSAPIPYPDRDPQNLVVYRQNYRLQHSSLPDTAFELLTRLHAGESLLAAVEPVVSESGIEVDELGPWLTQWFRQWAELGWVTAVVTPN